jgi:hypothetical protein
MKGLDLRLRHLEASTRPPRQAVDQEALRMKVRIMAELAGQGPKESPAEAIARHLGYGAPWKMAEAMRHDVADLQERWTWALNMPPRPKLPEM